MALYGFKPNIATDPEQLEIQLGFMIKCSNEMPECFSRIILPTKKDYISLAYPKYSYDILKELFNKLEKEYNVKIRYGFIKTKSTTHIKLEYIRWN